MDKIQLSRTFNKWTGGHEQLFCTRVYFNAKVKGGFWVPLHKLLDIVFYLLRGEKQHVRASYLWEVRNGKEKTFLSRE